jgi:hypothetical protein
MDASAFLQTVVSHRMPEMNLVGLSLLLGGVAAKIRRGLSA